MRQLLLNGHVACDKSSHTCLFVWIWYSHRRDKAHNADKVIRQCTWGSAQFDGWLLTVLHFIMLHELWQCTRVGIVQLKVPKLRQQATTKTSRNNKGHSLMGDLQRLQSICSSSFGNKKQCFFGMSKRSCHIECCATCTAYSIARLERLLVEAWWNSNISYCALW